MSLLLRQTASPPQRLNMREIIPEKLAELNHAAIAGLPLAVGRKTVPLGDLFDVSGTPGDELTIDSNSGKLDYVGAAMTCGRLTLQGVAGDYAGYRINGGELTVQGDSGDYTGSGMRTGRLVITGNVGDYLTAPPSGERKGLHGGYVQVKGNAGKRAGECMRRGLLIINGDTGPYLGCRMIAGTIFVGGQAGAQAGYGMRRGTLLLNKQPDSLPTTFNDNGRQRLEFIAVLLGDLDQRIDGILDIPEKSVTVDRYVGDLACDGRGEILIFARN